MLRVRFVNRETSFGHAIFTFRTTFRRNYFQRQHKKSMIKMSDDMDFDLNVSNSFVQHASLMFRRPRDSYDDISNRFCTWFGSSLFICVQLWKRLVAKGLLKGTKPYHLLWALYFLKSYNHEHTISAIVGADRKTVRKWIWCI